jgi:superfamily II DNA or RNA helicase
MIDNRKELQDECLELLTNPCKSILLLSPRTGKTALAISYIKKHKLKKVLWVTPSVKLRDVDIPDEFVKWKAKTYLSGTTIICYSSLSTVTGDFDLVILDEIQALTPANVEPFFNKSITTKSILGLTGTMPKHEEKLQIIKRLGLSVIKEVTIDEAVEGNMVADYKVNVLEVPLNSLDKNIKAGTKAKPFMTTEYANYAYLSKNVAKMMYHSDKRMLKFAILNRLRFIYNSPTKLETAKKLINYLNCRKLVFTGSIEHAESITKQTYHSKTNQDYLNLFLDEKIDLLACVNAGGTGFTYKNVDHFIIVQADSNKSGNVIQKISRGLLLQPDYVASIWVICLTGTQDENWVKNALESLDQNKIEYINIKNLKL